MPFSKPLPYMVIRMCNEEQAAALWLCESVRRPPYEIVCSFKGGVEQALLGAAVGVNVIVLDNIKLEALAIEVRGGMVGLFEIDLKGKLAGSF